MILKRICEDEVWIDIEEVKRHEVDWDALEGAAVPTAVLGIGPTVTESSTTKRSSGIATPCARRASIRDDEG